MTYEELCVEIIDAMEELDNMRAVPKTIVLSPGAFNTAVKHSPKRPSFFGMLVEVETLPPGVEFILRQEESDGE